jgi:dTDP-glucose pyrophosphorylase
MKIQFEDLFIDKNESLISALKQMDKIQRKLLIVLNKGKFYSLLSIGDIQRNIISTNNLTLKIQKALRPEVKVAHEGDDILSIKEHMRKNRNEFMPILKTNGEIKNVIFWEDIFDEKIAHFNNKFNIPVIIMAGGLGARLKPLTSVLPKPLLPIGEKTMMEEIFDRFANYGCNDFYVSVNYKAELIRYYVNELGLPFNIAFFTENSPLGTAGGLSLLKGKVNDTFFVTNCDILIEQDYSEILDYHRENRNEITVVAALKHFPIAYGTIETGENGKLIELIEKPELTFKINSGMYILEPHLIDEIPENECFHITDLIDRVIKKKGKVGVFPVSEKSWKDIGTWAEYLKIINP